MTESTPPIEARLTPGSAPQSETPGPGSEANTTALERVQLPRISIKFCTQCKWMLRAAYVGPFRILSSTHFLWKSVFCEIISNLGIEKIYRYICVFTTSYYL